MTVFLGVALAVGCLAVLRQVVGLGLLLRFFRRARIASIPKGPTPPLTLIKPLYGADPGLEKNLVATLRQNYPEFEVLFVHERRDDPALAAVEAATEEVPDVATRTLAGRDPDAANPKVAVLIRGEVEARHKLIVSADADVRPDPLYLRDVANGLAEADAVAFLPILFGMRTFWARAAGLAINSDAVLGLLFASGKIMTGSTIGVRREALEKIGGYRAVADQMADDYALGVALRRAGCRLTLARRAARLYMPGGGFGATATWMLRWIRTVRAASPVFYAALPLTLAPPLLIAAAFWTPAAALALLGAHTLLRALIGMLIDFRFCWDRSLVRALPLLPVLWLFEPLAMLLGTFGRTVRWRGRRYRLKGGRATLVDA